MTAQMLCFDLGSETYAVELDSVREIAPYRDVVRVPSIPSFVRGLLSRRDAAVPVIDLACKFGLGAMDGTDHTSVVVVDTRIDGGAALMGFLVDDRARVVEVGENDVEAVPELGAGIRVEFLRGIARVERRLLFLLDLDRALSATEVEALQGLAADHRARLEAAVADEDAATVLPRPSDERHRLDSGSSEDYIVFAVSGERLGLSLGRVRELLQRGTVTPVPGARDWIHGVINRRGQVMAVVDLAMCLGLPAGQSTARASILVLDLEVEGKPTEVGLAIDDILDVVSLGPDAIDAAPRVGAPVSPDHLRGVGRYGDGFVSLLEPERLLPQSASSGGNA